MDEPKVIEGTNMTANQNGSVNMLGLTVEVQAAIGEEICKRMMTSITEEEMNA